MSASFSGIWKSHPRIVGGLLVMLLGNSFLPVLIRFHRAVWYLDYLNVLALAFWAAGLCWQRARQEGSSAFGLTK